MDAMESIIKNLDWSPLFISLKTGIVATFISFFLGIYAARKVVKTTPGEKSDQGRSESESNCRWNPDTADGTATDCRRFLPAFDL